MMYDVSARSDSCGSMRCCSSTLPSRSLTSRTMSGAIRTP